MALISCPECEKSISDKAPSCPQCGFPLRTHEAGPPGPGYPGYYGYEYKSSATLFGMPLVHIVYGPGWGGFKPAKGFIAIGNIAIGVFAIGGFSVGILSLSGIGLGLLCIGGIAFGVVGAFGGVAVGYYAIGGLAIGVYAVGGAAIGPHTIYNDPQIKEFLRSLFGQT